MNKYYDFTIYYRIIFIYNIIILSRIILSSSIFDKFIKLCSWLLGYKHLITSN